MSLILYHHICNDGIFSALAAYLSTLDRPTFIAHGVTKDDYLDPQKLPEASALYLLDYCGPSEAWLRACCARYHAVHLVDHHKTAKEMMDAMGDTKPNNLSGRVLMEQSGCTLALDYFGVKPSDQLRELFNYVEDHDLWKHKLPSSELFTAGLNSLRLEYDVNKNPKIFQQLRALTADQLIELGHAELERTDRLIATYVASPAVYKAQPLGPDGPTLFCFDITGEEYGITSKLGHELSIRNTISGMGAVVSPPKNGEVRVSLRSFPGTDCSFIAKHFEGGGHAQACGFGVTPEVWESMKIKK